MPAELRSITIVALVSSHELDASEMAVIPGHGATGPPAGVNTPMRIGVWAAMKETA
jgi:hypothetical protein